MSETKKDTLVKSILLICLLFLSLIPVGVSANADFEKVDAALEYIQSSEFRETHYTKLDMSVMSDPIDALDFFMANYQIPFKSQIMLQKEHLGAVYALNTGLDLLGETFDRHQVENALIGIDKLVEQTRSEGYAISMLYTSGLAALHPLEDSRLAFRYWHLCADLQHAGCMNTLASSYFIGGFGLRQDLQKSLYLHQKTFETGIRYECAGVFSASAIQDILYLLTEIDKSRSWQSWSQEVNTLCEKLIERDQKDKKQQNVCRINQNFIAQYIFHLDKPEKAKEYLEQAQFYLQLSEKEEEFEPAYYRSMALIGSPKFSNNALRFQQQVEGSLARCSVGYYNIVFAHVDGQSQLTNELVDDLIGLNAVNCKEPRMLVELLRSEGYL